MPGDMASADVELKLRPDAIDVRWSSRGTAIRRFLTSNAYECLRNEATFVTQGLEDGIRAYGYVTNVDKSFS